MAETVTETAVACAMAGQGAAPGPGPHAEASPAVVMRAKSSPRLPILQGTAGAEAPRGPLRSDANIVMLPVCATPACGNQPSGNQASGKMPINQNNAIAKTAKNGIRQPIAVLGADDT